MHQPHGGRHTHACTSLTMDGGFMTHQDAVVVQRHSGVEQCRWRVTAAGLKQRVGCVGRALESQEDLALGQAGGAGSGWSE